MSSCGALNLCSEGRLLPKGPGTEATGRALAQSLCSEGRMLTKGPVAEAAGNALA